MRMFRVVVYGECSCLVTTTIVEQVVHFKLSSTATKRNVFCKFYWDHCVMVGAA
jgi:hypothetical protein